MDENKFVFERLSKKHAAFLSIANPNLPLEIRRTLCPHTSLFINSYKKALRLNVSRQRHSDCIHLPVPVPVHVHVHVQDINKLVEVNEIFVALNKRIKGFQSRWNGSHHVNVGTLMNNHAIMLIDYYEKALSEIFQGAKEFVHKLNDNVHTKEQIHLVIRLFPQVLTSEFHGYQPIQSAATHMRSVVFVPLLANKTNLTLPALVGQSVGRIDANANANANALSAQSAPSVINFTDSSSFSSRFSNPSEASYSIWQWLAVSTAEAIQDTIEHDTKYLQTMKTLEMDKLISKADLLRLSNSFGGVLNKNGLSCKERYKYILKSSTETVWDVGNTAKTVNASVSQLGSKSSLSAFDQALLPDNRFPGMRKKSSTTMRCVRRQQKKKSGTNMRRARPQEVTPTTASSNRIRKRLQMPRSVLNSSVIYERYLDAELAVEATSTSTSPVRRISASGNVMTNHSD